MSSRKHFSTSIKPSRLRKKYNSILCVAGKELNFSPPVWCEQYKSKKSTLSHETKVQFRPLAVYHILDNTDTYSLFSLYKRGGIESRAFKKKKNFEKKLEKNILEKKIWEKNRKKKFFGTNVEKKLWKKISKKNYEKKLWQKNFGKINYKRKIFITKIYSNIDKCHTIFSLLAPFDKTRRKTGKTSVVYDSK